MSTAVTLLLLARCSSYCYRWYYTNAILVLINRALTFNHVSLAAAGASCTGEVGTALAAEAPAFRAGNSRLHSTELCR